MWSDKSCPEFKVGIMKLKKNQDGGKGKEQGEIPAGHLVHTSIFALAREWMAHYSL